MLLKNCSMFFDSDGGGGLDWEELKVSFKGFGLDCEDDHAQDYVEYFDLDGDGLMGRDEFSNMLSERIKKVFDLFVMDRDDSKTAAICADDLRRVAGKLGRTLTDEAAEGMINFLDIDGKQSSKDNCISKEEFEQLILLPPDAMTGNQTGSSRLLETFVAPVFGQEVSDTIQQPVL